MHGDRADDVVELHLAFDEFHRQCAQQAGDEADDDRTHRIDEAAGRGDGDQACEQAVAGHRRVGFAVAQPHVIHRAERSGHPGEHRVHGHRADAEVAVGRGAQRRTRVEPEPAEREDEATEEHDHDVVPGNRVRAPVARELADARSDDDRHRKGRDAADRVHDA